MECPSCRAPVEFRPGGGKVKVCEYCQTVVLRGEAKLESIGKVADLVDTQSPLKVGLQGRYQGVPFQVQGRLQKSHGAGGWDEWYLSFEDGREGWLSESEGQWNLMFPLEAATLPEVKALEPLSVFTLKDTRFVVEEKAQATTVSAQGQLPDYNRQHVYVDATGPKGVFCSLDATDEGTHAFIGHALTLAGLGFDPGDLVPTPRRDALKAARCTNCNGALELKAPDAAKRVACPYCGALLDVSHGQLAFLQLLEKPPVEPAIALGRQGTLAGTKWTVLAFVVRSCTVEGTRYPWDEYLLWAPEKGFSWLMCANGHWTHLTPLAAGEVVLSPQQALHGGVTYKSFQSVFARTDYVLGECYWEVAVGELARATEYVAPPASVNVDQTETEATLTFGTLLAPEVVGQAFGFKPGVPTGIAPAQVNEFRLKAREAGRWAALWSGLLLLVVIAFAVVGDTHTIVDATFSVPPGAAPASPEAQSFSEPFRIEKKVPLEVKVDAEGLDNSWLGVSVDLVNVDTGEVIAVYAEPSYYSGVDDGERWSEGSRDQSKATDDVDPGQYVLRATPSFDPGRAASYRVTVSADDGPGFCCPYFIFLVLLVGPLWNLMRAHNFETEKWNEAVVQLSPTVSTFPHAKGSDDDDDDE